MPASRHWPTTAVAWAARFSLLAVVALAVAAGDDAGAHGGHPQKKLFGGHWWQVDFGYPMDLTTSNFFYGFADPPGPNPPPNFDPAPTCDGGINVSSCISKWSGPFQDAIDDWNAQPMDVNFVQTGDQNPVNDIRLIVVDLIAGNHNLLGVGLLYANDGTWCGYLPGDYDACTYYFGDALQADDAHQGIYGSNDVKRGTVLHEIGHLINLRHESVGPYPEETNIYPCGQDDTGAIPHSVMAYYCIDPPPIGLNENYVHDWDTCGVNHKYFDPVIGYAECGYDVDGDGVDEPPDNCPSLYNPTQSNVDADGSGDACDADIDGDGIMNGSDAEADGDRVRNTDEATCGSDPNDSNRRPERVDGVFAGVSDDGDAQVDEGLPPGAANYDCDGDGYSGLVEASVFSDGGNADRDPCGNNGWPSDLVPGGLQPNKLNIEDLGSFVVPVRRLGTSVGDSAYNARWDLAPGSAIGEDISLTDIGATILGASGYPPMFGGVTRAFGKACPWAP